ncbi:MAG: HEPN domain-containing protein [Deltaproteobacteria bacterium]|nr:HEPN domain-containing protein [Deltaproteobacteria bacterium]
MKEAEAAFRSGEALLKISDFRGAVNRFYYAAFYTIQALLILKGKDARTHSGNLHLFREEYIKTGLFPQETNKTLSQLFEERLESDYGFIDEPTQTEVEEAQKNCDLFLKKARGVFPRFDI